MQEKIKQLERIHVSAGDVQLDKNIKKAIERASIINKEDILHLQQKEEEATIDDEEKKI